jgi:long-chain acyl-CoA synthetase
MINIKPLEKTALIHKGQEISYESLLENIKKYSNILDIKPEDKVAIFSENRPEWIYAFFAVWEKCGVNVPIDFMSSEDELFYILNDSKPVYIFTSKNNKEKVLNVKLKLDYDIKVLVFEEIDFSSQIFENKECKKLEEDVAVILYTSGTTGQPKGVMLSYKNLLSNIKSIEKVEIANSQDSTLAILPFHHSYPLMVSMLIPLHLGATIVFLDELSPQDILDKLKKYKITILIGVPRLYALFHKRIFDKINEDFFIKTVFGLCKKINNQTLSKIVFKRVHDIFGGSIKYFVSGGAKLDLDIAKDFHALGFKIIEGYGLTETSPIISFNPPYKIKLGSVGKPIEGVQVKIEDDEILVKGDNVFVGYLNKIEETKKAFKNGYFMTGDLGYLDKDGYLYITGRKKEIIVLPNGKNINPEEIENIILKNFDIVKEIAVIQKDNQLFAIIYPDFEVVKKRKIVNLEETIKWNVIDKYNQSAASYKKIGGFKIVNTELPKTRLGKIRRFMLNQFLEKQERTAVKEEPNTQTYSILKEYLEKYTNLSVYPDSHIEIDLGLDSLGKIEFLTFIESTFGIKLDEKDLIENPTVEKLSYFIDEKKQKIEISEIDWKKILSQPISFELKEGYLTIIKPILKLYFKLYNNLEIKGIENIPNQPVIFAPNHQSYLDGFLIVASLPNHILKKTYFLAEEAYFNTSFRRRIAKNFNIITVNVNKDLKGSLIKSVYVLKNGKNVVIFPEGARTRDGKLLPFKKGFAILSKELNIPVVPVVIKGAFESLPINKSLPSLSKISVEFLNPVYPENKSYDEIVKIIYDEISKKL